MRKYGVKTTLQLKEVRDKITSTLLAKYGTTKPQETQVVKEKTRKTCLKRYGAPSYVESEHGKAKISGIVEEKYGVSTPLQSNVVQKKCRETLFKNYGVSSPLKLKEIYERVKKTNFERYGTEFIGSAMSDAISEGHRKHWSKVIGEDAYSRLRDRDLMGYHFQKFLLAKSKGIRLFQFWGFEIIETPEDVLETIQKAKNGFKPEAERVFIKIDNMKPFIIDGNLYHLEEPKMTVWNGLELWDAGTSYFLSK